MNFRSLNIHKRKSIKYFCRFLQAWFHDPNIWKTFLFLILPFRLHAYLRRNWIFFLFSLYRLYIKFVFLFRDFPWKVDESSLGRITKPKLGVYVTICLAKFVSDTHYVCYLGYIPWKLELILILHFFISIHHDYEITFIIMLWRVEKFIVNS